MVLGAVTLARAWYHCAACGHGLAPRDDDLGVVGQSMSPGLAAMNDKAAAAGPFAKAARLLEDLVGIRLTVKRVERRPGPTAPPRPPRTGARPRSSRPARWSRCRHPRCRTSCMPPSTAPASRLPRSTPRAGRARRRRSRRTREVKLAVFFTQDKIDANGYPVCDQGSSSYIATFEPARVFAALVKAEGIRRGADHIRHELDPSPTPMLSPPLRCQQASSQPGTMCHAPQNQTGTA
jgi:hypothetical protein